VAVPAWAHDQLPAGPQTRPVAIVGATVHTLTGGEAPVGTVMFEQGKITLIANAVDVTLPADALVIDGKSLHVYPGLIDASNTIGLVEIGAVRATRDTDETGDVNPNVQARVAVNPDSELIPVTRSEGVLISNVVPEGGLVSGTASAMLLDGWTWEQMTLRPRTGIAVRWPGITPSPVSDDPEAARNAAKGRDDSLRKLDQLFDDARAYAKSPSNDYDARLDSMKPLLDGSIPLLVYADEQAQIESAVAFAQRQRVKLVLVGGADAGRCIDLLKQFDIPVILTGTHRTPRSSDDAIDDLFTLPARLRQAGVRFAISSSRGNMNVRNLPYEAGSAVANGLSRDDGVRSVTLWPAQLLGIAGQTGSIDLGKDATLIVTNGDILESTTRVQMAFVQGRPVDLNDKQKRLAKKYEGRETK
jgi:imidazolonepropionase-like amidohydrolase